MNDFSDTFYEKMRFLNKLSLSRKKLIIGVDEAGYGPNLGPLVIGGSAWIVPFELTETEFCVQVNQICQPKAWHKDCQHVPLGDSKKLYSSGNLRTLEYGLLALMAGIGELPRTLEALIDRHANLHPIDSDPAWYKQLNEIEIPSSACDLGEIQRLKCLTTPSFAKSNIRLVDVAASIITEPEFNRSVRQYDSKGKLLSLATLGLVQKLSESFPELPIEAYCDRQGGRKNYLPMLLEWQPNIWFAETRSSKDRCSYQGTDEKNSVPNWNIHFTVGGDSFPPTALASLMAKYLRERLMEQFNLFWANQQNGLKPTAGYPVDAIRFRNSIEPLAQQMNLPLDSWWRHR